MKILELKIENFGPFYQPTSISFSEENGVTVIWGPNGRGKTTILNAFRFALYGEIKKRNDEKVDYPSMINKIGFDEGKYYFKIELKLLDEGISTIIREYRAKNTILLPKSKDDYEFNTFVRKNGSILSKEDSKHYLNSILPSEISRFFLFDGELLQEYESLLSNESSAGYKIKESIERILGLPILVNGKSDISEYSYAVEKKKLQSIQADEKAAKFSETYTSILDEIKIHQKIIAENNVEINDLIVKKRELEERIKNTDRIREWLTSIENAKNKIKLNETIIDNRKNELKRITKDAWKFNLKEQVDKEIEDLNSIINELKSREVNTAVNGSVLEMLNEALNECQCPLCTQSISQTIIPFLQKKQVKLVNDSNMLTEEEKSNLSKLEHRLSNLRQMLPIDYSNQICNLISEINNSMIAISDANQIIENSKKDLDKAEYDSSEQRDVLALPEEYSKVSKQIDNLTDGNNKEKNLIDELIKKRDKLNKQISQASSSSDLSVWNNKANICNDILNIFSEGVDLFSKRLKNNVEKDAQELFCKISNDKDYTGLEINDSYGLHIVHRTGQRVPMRSAGYEHVVALSLIYALHKNAPFRGPIIMDSPYGRLDVNHKKNVTKVLPDMAEQTLLLMYEGEITRDDLVDSLENNLVKEYNLIRIGSFETKIE